MILEVEVVTNVRSSIGSEDIRASTRNFRLLFQTPLCSWQEFRSKQGRTGHVNPSETQASSLPHRPERASISAHTHTLALGVACDNALGLRARLLSAKPLPASVQSNARPSSTTWFHCPRYHVLADPSRQTTHRRHLRNQRTMISACCKTKCLVMRHEESQRSVVDRAVTCTLLETNFPRRVQFWVLFIVHGLRVANASLGTLLRKPLPATWECDLVPVTISTESSPAATPTETISKQCR